MKIAVCVKEVPSATSHRRLDPATNRLDRSGDSEPNPFDVHALEEAIRIREGATVVGVTTLLVLVILVVNLLVDLLYAVLDPRIRYD